MTGITTLPIDRFSAWFAYSTGDVALVGIVLAQFPVPLSRHSYIASEVPYRAYNQREGGGSA